ncbi:MAG: DUF885 domain-containing protein [Myxococcota bacterium]
MPRPLSTCLLLVLTLLACRTTEKTRDQRTLPPLSPSDANTLVEGYLTDTLEEAPAYARSLGLHEYDGKVMPVGPAAVSARVARAQAHLKRLTEVDWSTLPDPQRLDLELTQLHAQQTVFALQDRLEHRRVLFYGDQFDVSSYLVRDYAPLQERVEALIRHLDAAVANTDAVLNSLDLVQARSHLITAKIISEGTLEYLSGDVVELSGPALQQDAGLKARFERSHGAAIAQVRRVMAWIEQALPKANEDFRLGETLLLRMLQVNEGLKTDLTSLRRMAEEDFTRNRAAFEEVARRIAPDKDVMSVVAMVANERVPQEQLLDVAQKQLDDLRAFIEENDVITIPSADRATVAVTPPFMRYNSAFLDPAGPFEKAKTSYYYITPPDPSWPPEKQLGYLPYYGDLLATSIHEVYPGHFVQALHLDRAPSRAQKVFGSYAFSEGWAHYTEQMMLDAGFGGGQDRLRLGQLSNALLRNCRFLATLGLHVDGLSVDQAQRLFQEKCFVDEGNAQQQANRGTYDPGYLSYTLGKLQILGLREKFFAKRNTRSLREFHDWLLSFGGAPLALIEKRL